MAVFRAVLVSLLPVVFFALQKSSALACAVVWEGNVSPALVEEEAIILWNNRDKTEHFIRSVKFEGNVDRFGFLVPVPSRPEVAKGDMTVFPKLKAMAAKNDLVNNTYDFAWGDEFRWEKIARRMPTLIINISSQDVSEYSSSGVKTVEVVEEDDFTATVLKVTKLDDLQAWLSKNEFDARPEIVKWAGNYVGEDWHIVAFMFRKPAEKQFLSTAVRISFKADQPFYPYREPLGSIQNSFGARLQRLILLSSEGLWHPNFEPGFVTLYRSGPGSPKNPSAWSFALFGTEDLRVDVPAERFYPGISKPRWDSPGKATRRLVYSNQVDGVDEYAHSILQGADNEKVQYQWLQYYTDSSQRRADTDIWFSEGGAKKVFPPADEVIRITLPRWSAWAVGGLSAILFITLMRRRKHHE